MSAQSADEFPHAADLLRRRLDRVLVARLERGNFAENLLRHLRERRTPRLPFSPERLPEIAALAKRLDPVEWAWEQEIADEAAAGRMYGATNPYCRRFLAPDPAAFDFSAYDHPDPQTIHGLNRHRWFAALARAYWLDRDRRYFDALMRHWDFFVAKVPPLDEAFFARVHNIGGPALPPPFSELDVSIRLTNWWWAYWLALYAEEMTPERNVVLLARCLRHFDLRAARGARVLEHNFTAMQMESLYFWAASLPEAVGMEVWRHLARTTLESSLAAAVHDDGVQYEKSAGYHMGCQRWYGAPLRMAQANGETWSEEYARRLRAMAEYTDAIVLPDGGTPLISDSDRTDAARHAQALARTLFPDMTFRRPVGPTYFSLWLSDGLTWAPESVVAPKPLAAVFTKGGVAVARTSEHRMASYALLDNGPTRAGHAHKNNLTIHYEAFGLPVVVDPGRAIYRPDADRSWVTACESHNTLFIEDTPIRAGERIAVPALHVIPFPDDPRLGKVSVEESDRFFLLRSRFSGYAPEPGASVLRSIFLGRDETAPWLAVVDEIISPTEHTWTNSWLLPSSEAVATIEGGFRLRLDSGLFVHLRVCAGGPLDLRDDAMFWCPQYGEKSPARWVRFSRRCAAERRVAMLVPARESNGSVNARFAALEAALRSVP